MINLCMFDLDGTIANTIEDLKEAMNYALNKYGLPGHSQEEYKILVGDGIIVLAERASNSKDPELIKKLVSAFDEYYSAHLTDNTKPYDGCTEMLKRLNNMGVKCGVLSNKPHQYVDRIVSKLYPDIDFVCKLGKQDGFEPKPNPSSLLKTLSDLNISQSECMYIGDSNVDIRTAKNADVVSCGVTWGFRTREELVLEGADFVADLPDDIYETVLNINGEKL